MWKLSLLLVLLFSVGGCAHDAPLLHTHDVSQPWPHNPYDIDELVIHMDEKINLNIARIKRIEEMMFIPCEADPECAELLFHDER